MAPELVQLVILYLMAVNLAAFFLMGVTREGQVREKMAVSRKRLCFARRAGRQPLGGLLGWRFFHP